MINLLNLDLNDLEAWMIEAGAKKHHAKVVFQSIHQKGEKDFEKMSGLNTTVRKFLYEHSHINSLQVSSEKISHDGTIKWLLSLEDGKTIETVFIPETKRGTLCVSSQVGCELQCDFCATGKQGFQRNLTVAEIIG